MEVPFDVLWLLISFIAIVIMSMRVCWPDVRPTIFLTIYLSVISLFSYLILRLGLYLIFP